MSAIVHRIEHQGPAAHALVIGVGDYPHLKGGKGPLFSGHENMGQLDSAPRSAREFANWLLGKDGYHDPDRPLASVRLLLSEKKGLLGKAAKFKNSETGETIAVPGATLAEVEAGVLEWAEALDTSQDHLGILFFSGHGVMAGVEQILLLSDFGKPGLNTRNAAIRFNSLRNGMTRIAAREQCYFLDACRAYTRAFADAQGARGANFIDPDPDIRIPRRAAQPVFNATVEGASAFGRDGEPGLFTQALLQALKGGGTANRHPPYDWRIDVGHLNDAIGFLVGRTAEREGLGFDQVASAEDLRTIGLGKIRGEPLIPVGLRCSPEDATKVGRFVLPENGEWKRGQPDPLVRYGRNRFEVSFGDGSFGPGTFETDVIPPFKIVEVPVSPGGGT